jgi:hypothetical protein
MCVVVNDIEVKEYIARIGSEINTTLWEEPKPFPNAMPLKIDNILKWNHSFDRYLLEHPNEVNDFQLMSILSMFRCVKGEFGGKLYTCPECGETKEILFGCHSRSCVRCGKRYAESWGRKLMEKFFPVDQRHIIFTLPGPLWDFVLSRGKTFINDMFDAVVAVINKIFTHKFKRLSVRPGIILIIHYTGRDMKSNPHIHVIATEGGLTKEGKWKPNTYWPYNKMNQYWKYEVLTRFRSHHGLTLDEKAIIDDQRKQRFKDGTNGYVVKNYRDILDVKEFGSYLARYIRHPPIGESRLLGFDGLDVRIKYEWDNKLFITDVSIERFIEAILVNISPKGFQEVRYCGLYTNLFYKKAVKVLIGVSMRMTSLDEYYDDGIKEGVFCIKCKVVMEPMVLTYLQNGRMVRIIY